MQGCLTGHLPLAIFSSGSRRRLVCPPIRDIETSRTIDLIRSRQTLQSRMGQGDPSLTGHDRVVSDRQNQFENKNADYRLTTSE